MTKQVTYTEEQAQELATRYAAGTGETVAALAEAFGKSVQSVTAKLVRMKVYKGKAAADKGTGRVTKADLVKVIEGRYAVDEGTFADMEKLTKSTLEMLARID